MQVSRPRFREVPECSFQVLRVPEACAELRCRFQVWFWEVQDRFESASALLSGQVLESSGVRLGLQHVRKLGYNHRESYGNPFFSCIIMRHTVTYPEYVCFWKCPVADRYEIAFC